ARIDALVAAVTDPISGQPESKAATVQVARYNAAWYGFAVSAAPLAPDCSYWARAVSHAGHRAELAGDTEISDWETEARRLFGLPAARATSLCDPARGTARIAFSADNQLTAALFVAPTPVAVMRDYLATLPNIDAAAALVGRPLIDQPDPGPVLCSCFGIGVNTVLRAIEEQALLSVEEIGTALQAGTNCGSCRPELAALLRAAARREAAE
ncbi:MAG: (2Fe-2S)-binding protein, partial [Pseudomonadota bacterium]